MPNTGLISVVCLYSLGLTFHVSVNGIMKIICVSVYGLFTLCVSVYIRPIYIEKIYILCKCIRLINIRVK